MSNKNEQDLAFIQALADLMRSADLSEIDIEREYGEDDELKVRLTRATAPAMQAAPMVVAAPQAVAASAAAAPAAEGPDLSNAVMSPMVGTVFLAPEPGAANFVSAGDMVEEGQTILIIEAMKTMNHIPSPRAGRVRAILVENAEPVEFDEPLIIIE